MKAPVAPRVSSSEREVLEALARGQTDREVAAARHVSTYTVRTRRRIAYEKLEVNSLVQAMAALGWVRVVD